MASTAELDIIIRARDQASRALRGIQGATQRLGGALKRLGKIAVLGAAVGLVALGTAALKFGSDFQSAFNTIRVGTGATGEALAGLNDDFKAVLRTGPEGMDAVAKSISTLSTLTGEAGNSLRGMARNALDAARIMGEDSGPLMDEAGKAIKRMNLEGRDATAFFDKLFVASQNTNVPMQTLAKTLNDYGPVLTNLGLGLENQIALIGQLTSAGLDVSRVMPGINAFMRKLADEGVTDLGQAFEDTLGTIAGAGSAAEALKIATAAFGAEGAQRLSVAVRTGTLDIAELAHTLGLAEGAIAKTAKESRTWQENLSILKNKVLVKMEPLLTGMIDKLTNFTDWLSRKGIPLAEDFGRTMQQEFQPAIDAVRDAFASLEPKIQDILRVAQKLFPFLKDNEKTMKVVAVIVGSLLVGAFVALTVAVVAFTVSMIAAALPFIAIVAVIAALSIGIVLLIKHWDSISAAIVDATQTVWNVIKGVWDRILSFLKDNWKEILSVALLFLTGPGGLVFLFTSNAFGIRDKVTSAIGAIPGLLLGLAGKFFSAAKNLGGQLLEGLKDALTGATGFASDVANAVLRAVKSVVNGVISDINSALEFKISVPFAPDIHVNPPDIPPLKHGAANIPRDMLAFLHRGEMIVPQPIAAGLRAGAHASAAGGGLTVNFFGGIQLSGTATQQNADDLMAMVKRSLRSDTNRGL